MLEDEVAEITNMSATDIWIKDLDVLESAWNEFLKSGKVNGNDDQQLHNNIIIDVGLSSGLTQQVESLFIILMKIMVSFDYLRY